MIELNINNLTKYYGANKIFENISFDIKTGERIGLIGQNGCGKTTIMKILMDIEEHQGGEISFRKGNKVGYLNQIPSFQEDFTTMDVLRLAFEPVYEIKKQMDELEQRMAQSEGEVLEKAMNNYSRLLEQYELSGGYDLETNLNKITEGLQITGNLKEIQFNRLSGGEKTRVILAKLLLEKPDILLLDEPTNHLDLTTTEWLEGFLKEYRGAAIIISHDRYFLDSVVSKIVELEFDHAEVYLGNYSYYVIEKERRFLLEFKNYQNQQKKIERMEAQIERYRIWGVMRDSEKMFKRAKELEKRLEKVEVLKRPILESRKIRLNQSMVGRSGKIVLEINNIEKSFGERVLIKDVNLNLFYQDSACIIGENGSGKTTLLKMILGELEPDRGTVKVGSQVIIGYLPQQVEFKDEEQTVLEYFADTHSIAIGAARSQLAKALFLNEDVNKKIKYLSGGEKSRLKLCSLTFRGANLLILDEPTNHLDIDSREVLEETLSEFEGTLLFVSHDRYFISKVADKIIVLEDSSIKEYAGDYAYYQEESRKEAEKQAGSDQVSKAIKGRNLMSAEVKEKTAEWKTTEGEINNAIVTKETRNVCNNNAAVSLNDWKDKKRTSSNSNLRKLMLLEKSIEEMEDKMKSLEELMELHNTEGNRLKELFDEKEKIVEKLETAYVEWEALQS